MQMSTYVRNRVPAILCLFFSCLIPLTAFAQKGVTADIDVNPAIAGMTVAAEFQLDKAYLSSTSYNVHAHFFLPSGVSHLSNDSGCTVVNPGELDCDFGNLGNGSSREVNFVFAIEPDAVVNTGPTSFSIAGHVSQNGQPNVNFSDDFFIDERADIRIESFQSKDTVFAGDQYTYTIIATNYGPSSARNIIVYDTIASHPAFQGGGFLDPNGCSIAVRTDGGLVDEFECNFAMSTGVFDLGTFGANWLNPFEPRFDSDPDAQQFDQGRVIITINLLSEADGNIFNTSNLTTDTFDPNISNNSSITKVVAVGTADLTVTKTASGELQEDGANSLPYNVLNPKPFPDAPDFAESAVAVTAGRRIRYTIDVVNDGLFAAQNVTVFDSLPSGVQVVPGSLVIDGPNGGSCLYGTPGNPMDKMICGLGALTPVTADDYNPGDESAQIQFDVIVDLFLSENSLLTNNVYVESHTKDIDNSGDFDATITVVSPLVGVGGCSVGGPYDSVVCDDGSTTDLLLNGFGYALPEAGGMTYNWSTTCLDGTFDDNTIENPTLSFTRANPDNSPVSCDVELEVENAFVNSTCSGSVMVVDCVADCNGVLAGDGELDRCGECDGDGTSCLGCKAFDVSSNIADANAANQALRKLVVRAGRKLVKAGGPLRFAKKRRSRATRIVRLAELSNDSLPVTGQNCTNALFCSDTSNIETLDSSSSAPGDLQKLLRRVVGKWRQVSGKRRAGKKLLQRASGLVGDSETALAGVPLSTSDCS